MASKGCFAKLFHRGVRQILLIGLILGLSSGCDKEYDLERSQPDRGTFGEELYEIWLKDTQRAAIYSEERTNLLVDREREFITSVDRAVPAGHVKELDDFLISFIAVTDAGYFPALTRRVSAILDEAASDEELMASLDERGLYGAGDFLSPRKQGRFVAEMTAYEELPELIAHLGHGFAERDGLDDQGQPILGGPSSYADLLRALTDLMQKEPPADAADRWATTLRDLLMVVDNRFRGGEPPRRSFVALFDDRGLPMVRLNGDGEIPAPFVDAEGNGLADIDGDGRFLMTDGKSLAIAPLSDEPVDHPEMRRDVDGRVEFGPGQFAFRYVDISDTALPFLVRMVGGLAEEETFYHMAAVGRQLLGPAVVGEDARGDHRAFKEFHPFVDLMDAIITGMAISELPEVMELTARYIDRQVDDLAFLSYAVGETWDVIADNPGTDIYDNQTLLFDLLEVFREITADPELWADVMEAMRDPILERAGEAMGTLVRYRDQEAVPVDGGPYDHCFQQCKESHLIGTNQRFDCIRACPNDEIFSDLMDHDSPESALNRSMLQRLFHLLRDTAGVEYIMAVEEAHVPGFDLGDLPPMVELPGAAEAFIRSVAGELNLSDYISDEFTQSSLGQIVEFLKYIVPGLVDDETVGEVLSIASELFGARLDTMPTPDQITRLFNQPDLRYEEDDVILDVTNPRCKDGFEMAAHHADGLFASEASGLIDVLYPLAVAFSKHDREELMAELFIIVHDHYSSRSDLYPDAQGNDSLMKGSNLVSLEPALVTIFEDGTLFDALRGMAMSTRNLTDDHGVAIDERLRQLIHKWVRNDDDYELRSGPSSLILADGRELENLSRVDVVLDRASTMVERIEDNEQAMEHVTEAVEGFFNVVLRAEKDEGGARFAEEGTIAFGSHGLRYLAKRARQKEEQGRFEPWLLEELPDMAMQIYTSRGFFAVVELLEALHKDEEDRHLLAGMLGHFAESGERTDQMAFMVYGLIVQAFDLEALMPIGRFIMSILDPDREESAEPHRDLPNGTIVARVLGMAGEVDNEGHGMELLGRASISGETYDSTLSVLSTMVMRYLSENPDADDPMSIEDRKAALRRMGFWLGDNHRGLERYFDLLDQRAVD